MKIWANLKVPYSGSGLAGRAFGLLSTIGGIEKAQINKNSPGVAHLKIDYFRLGMSDMWPGFEPTSVLSEIATGHVAGRKETDKDAQTLYPTGVDFIKLFRRKS